ncbi:unnamed protein product [Blepharisma stoltei]|uniref:Uncharacterized protein n=1 Tax=Blepharisma stoltei TaxID=1481888 RepID=A0AAU9JKN2_9CILI|nr:unnamed protein product [Blepharisma stoltei]
MRLGCSFKPKNYKSLRSFDNDFWKFLFVYSSKEWRVRRVINYFMMKIELTTIKYKLTETKLKKNNLQVYWWKCYNNDLLMMKTDGSMRTLPKNKI